MSLPTPVIRRMTRISDATPGSINLSQGFPDFDPPQVLLDALREMAAVVSSTSTP